MTDFFFSCLANILFLEQRRKNQQKTKNDVIRVSFAQSQCQYYLCFFFLLSLHNRKEGKNLFSFNIHKLLLLL